MEKSDNSFYNLTMNSEQIARFFSDSTDFLGSVRLNENLSSHTTMHVGGNAKLFLEPENEESLVFAIKELKKLDADERRCTRIKSFFVLGGGSNVIISDAGLPLVISTRKMNGVKLFADELESTDLHGFAQIKGSSNGEKFHTSRDSLCPPKPYEHSSSGDSLKSRCDFLTLPICEEFKILQIDSGASWGSVISFCKKENLGGFEGFTGLSGTVGGALFMNATCFGLSACDNLLSVRYFDLHDGEIHTYEKNPSDWGYKKSPFQNLLTTDYADYADSSEGGVAGLSPQRGKRATKCERGERLLPLVILSAKFSVKNGFDSEKSEKCISDRKEKGHFRAPSAGSAFKNDAAHGIIAGKVIDECGLKGFSVGGAQIAPWHGNFIINPEQKASAEDVKKLSDEVKKIVFEKQGVRLENEILFIES